MPVSFKQKLANLEALDDASISIVGAAAALVARRSFDDLVRELLAAYDRLFDPG